MPTTCCRCVKCVKCSKTSPGVHATWYQDYSLCGPCQSQLTCLLCNQDFVDGEFCVKCSSCEHLMHGKWVKQTDPTSWSWDLLSNNPGFSQPLSFLLLKNWNSTLSNSLDIPINQAKSIVFKNIYHKVLTTCFSITSVCASLCSCLLYLLWRGSSPNLVGMSLQSALRKTRNS